MKVVMSIAGSDSSGGAGIQADLKTFEAFGVFGTTAITVLTAQNTSSVKSLLSVTPQFLSEQIDAVMDDFELNAIKIGMLYSNELIDVVREKIKNLNIPIVFDPVFIAKSGSILLRDETISNLKSLIPYVTLTTPNIFEANKLFGFKSGDSDSLNEIINSNANILIKNQILTINGKQRSVDTLFFNRDKETFDAPLLDSRNTHGTGCSYSSAIAANLALGKSLSDSISIAKKFIYLSIKNSPGLGWGDVGPIAHKIGGEICALRD